MATIVTVPVTVPEPRDTDLVEVVGTNLTPPPRIPRHGWRADEPEEGFALFAIKRDPKSEPEPLTPKEALRLVESGVPLADPEEAYRAVQDLGRRANYGPARLQRYRAVIGAHWRRVWRERRERALAKLGMAEGDNFDPRKITLLTREDLAAIMGVSVRTIDRWNGTVLPRGLKIGGRVFWKAEAILKYLEAA